MITAPFPINESNRLQDLFETELLDTPTESEFDDIVKLASQIWRISAHLFNYTCR